MKLKILRGTTSKLLRIFVQDSTSTTGGGLTGLAYNASGLAWYYLREGDASPTAVTLATATVGTWTSGGLIEVSSSSMPGIYELGLPNAVISTGNSVVMMLRGAANMVPVLIEIELDAVNYQDATRLGLTALPNANAAASGGLPTVDANNAVKLQNGTGANQISLSSGAVTAGTVSDKTGYSLTQTFPANFADLAIAATTGRVTAGTVSDKTGYSLTQSFPSNFASMAITAGGAVTAGTVSDKTGYSLSGTQTFDLTGDITGNLSGSVGSISGVTFPANFGAFSVDTDGRVDLGYVGGTAATLDPSLTGTISAATDGANFTVDWDNSETPAANALAGRFILVTAGALEHEVGLIESNTSGAGGSSDLTLSASAPLSATPSTSGVTVRIVGKRV